MCIQMRSQIFHLTLARVLSDSLIVRRRRTAVRPAGIHPDPTVATYSIGLEEIRRSGEGVYLSLTYFTGNRSPAT
jgi:hypothetical protein